MVFIPELSSGTWLEHFQRFGKKYFLIEVQIIPGFDRICGIQNTDKDKYNEFTKCMGNLNFHRPLDVLKHGVNLLCFLIIFSCMVITFISHCLSLLSNLS